MIRASIALLAGLVACLPAVAPAQQTGPVVHVYKSVTCRCCSKWVDHMRQAGFDVRATDLSEAELSAFKVKHGVPEHVRSCHTAVVGDYVIEGHVPATDVRRLLNQRSSMRGLAVAGMQRGSPGMEVAGAEPRQYLVLGFDREGNVSVFANRRG